MKSNEQNYVSILKDALVKISRIEDKYEGDDWQEIEEAREIAKAALKNFEQTQDNT